MHCWRWQLAVITDAVNMAQHIGVQKDQIVQAELSKLPLLRL
jgi:hypothetical protein